MGDKFGNYRWDKLGNYGWVDNKHPVIRIEKIVATCAAYILNLVPDDLQREVLQLLSKRLTGIVNEIDIDKEND